MVSLTSDHDLSADTIELSRRTKLPDATPNVQVMESHNAVASPSKTVETPFEARKRVAFELYNTEVFYVESLEKLMKIRRFLYDEKFLDTYQISLIFSNIPRILKIHRQFLKKVEALKDNWSPQSCLGTLFVHFAQHFRQYSIYATNFPLADDLLSKLLDNERAQLITKKFETLVVNQQSAGLDIRSLLIMPVQRIPRYRLFIETLIKITPGHFLDKLLLGKALVAMKGTATFIDDTSRFKEGLFRAKKLQNKITPRIPATATRALVQQGTLMKISSGFKMLERTFFFFSDCFFVYAHQQKDGALTQYTKAHTDTLVGVEILARVNNRNKKAICYGVLPANSSDVAVSRDMMLKKHAADSEFYFFLVYGQEKQFWINTGNFETLKEWMESFEWVWPNRPYVESHDGLEHAAPGRAIMSNTSGALQVMSARHAISDAIRKGVPMWNKGDFRGCTKVYRDVAVRFAKVEPMLGKALKDIAGKPVDSSRNSQGMLLRHVFNEIRIKYDPVRVCTTGIPSRRISTQSSTRNPRCPIMFLDSIGNSSTLASPDSENNRTDVELLQARERTARRMTESRGLAPTLESAEAAAIASSKVGLAKVGMSSDKIKYMVEQAKTTPQKSAPLLEVYNAHQAVLRNQSTINQCQATLTRLDQRLGELQVQRTPVKNVMEEKVFASPTSERLDSESAVPAPEQQHLCHGLSDTPSTNKQLLDANKELKAEVRELKARIDRMQSYMETTIISKLEFIIKGMQQQT